MLDLEVAAKALPREDLVTLVKTLAASLESFWRSGGGPRPSELSRKSVRSDANGRSLAFSEIQTLSLALIEPERDMLFDKLMDNSMFESDPEWEYVDGEAAWEAELQRRIDDVESGREELIPAEVVHREIQELLASFAESARHASVVPSAGES